MKSDSGQAVATSKERRKSRRALQRAGQPLPPDTSPRTPSKPPPKTLWKRIPGKVWGGIAAAAALVAFACLYPVLSIEEDFALNSLNPYETMFSVSNEGFLPATHLTSTCIINTDVKTNHSRFAMRDSGSVNVNFVPVLFYKHRQTIPCFHTLRMTGEFGKDSTLRIEISYGVLWLPVHKPQTFNFVVVQAADGSYHWQYRG